MLSIYKYKKKFKKTKKNKPRRNWGNKVDQTVMCICKYGIMNSTIIYNYNAPKKLLRKETKAFLQFLTKRSKASLL